MSHIYRQIKGIKCDVTTKEYEGWVALKSVTKTNSRNIGGKVDNMDCHKANTPDFKEIEVLKSFKRGPKTH